MILEQVRRFRNGRRLGLVFVRNRWFRMPQSVRIGGARVALSYPPEAGVKNDFIACAVRNDYGLGKGAESVTTILDVGANVGFFSLCARNYYPQAKIHAYEPNPRAFSCLKTNVRECGVEIFTEAIGAAPGKVVMVDTADSNLAATRPSDTGTISQISFRLAISRIGDRVDLLKLDCEGAEWDLLAAGDCWSAIRHVRMEYHLVQSHVLPELEGKLQSLGFRITACRPEGPTFGTLWAENVG
jgi:FkbM family methyltransferase